MLTPSSNSTGRYFRAGRIDIYTRPDGRLLFSHADETHEWLCAENPLDLREWS